MLEHLSNERKNMNATANVLLRDYAGLKWPAMNHKGRIGQLERLLRLGHRRVRSIYNNEPGVSLRADEMAAIEALRNAKAEEANRHEFQALEARLASMEAALQRIDQEFHFVQVAAFRSSVDGRREHHEPVTTQPGE